MASKATEPTSNVPAKATIPDFSYSVDELANAARNTFGVSPDMVRAAFAVNNLKEATLSDAKKIVAAFAKKEVK